VAVDGSGGCFEPKQPPQKTDSPGFILKGRRLSFGAAGAEMNREGKTKMLSSILRFSKLTSITAITLFGSSFAVVQNARAVEPASSQNGPVITRTEVKKLTKTAKSAEDHMRIARYYNAQADRFESSAAGYDEAAARYRNGPMVKNLMSPTTPGRYEFLAKGFREEASSNRELAASHERMAKNTAAGF